MPIMSGSTGNRVGTPDVLRVSWFLEVRQISQGERPGCCRLGAEESREGGKSYSESQGTWAWDMGLGNGQGKWTGEMDMGNAQGKWTWEMDRGNGQGKGTGDMDRGNGQGTWTWDMGMGMGGLWLASPQ